MMLHPLNPANPRLTSHCPAGDRTAVLTAVYPGKIILARPLLELGAHIRHFKIPSFQLIARSIKALVLGIFRGHFCDRILLTIQGHILHSFKGRVRKQDPRLLQELYPYMLKKALVLEFKREEELNTESMESHPHHDRHEGGDEFLRLPGFRGYSEISAQTIRDYFKDFYGVRITSKETGNTLKDILKANKFDTSSLVF